MSKSEGMDLHWELQSSHTAGREADHDLNKITNATRTNLKHYSRSLGNLQLPCIFPESAASMVSFSLLSLS